MGRKKKIQTEQEAVSEQPEQPEQPKQPKIKPAKPIKITLPRRIL